MTLPSSFDKRTVTGSYSTLTGDVATGTVTFQLLDRSWLTAVPEKVLIVPKPIVVELVDGAFSIQLPATNDPDITPTGFVYQVIERVAGEVQERFIEVPISAGPLVITDPALIPVQPVTVATRFVTSINGIRPNTLGEIVLALPDDLYQLAPGALATDGTLTIYDRAAVGTDLTQSTFTVGTDGTITGLVVSATGIGDASIPAALIETSGVTKTALAYQIAGDGAPRFSVDATAPGGGAVLSLGDGTTTDVNLYRSALNTLATDDVFQAVVHEVLEGPFTVQSGRGGLDGGLGVLRVVSDKTNSEIQLVSQKTGDVSFWIGGDKKALINAAGELRVLAGGVLKLGTAGDTSLYRNGANSLATEGSLTVAGGVTTSKVTLAADPLAPLEAATKGYVDTGLVSKADLVAGKVPQSQLPASAMTEFLGVVASQAAMLALDGQPGDWASRSDLGTDWQLVAADPTQLSSWRELTYPASPVSSVAGRTGAIVLSTGDIGGLDPALAARQLVSEKNEPNGYVGLDVSAKILGAHQDYGDAVVIEAVGNAASAGIEDTASRSDHVHPDNPATLTRIGNLEVAPPAHNHSASEVSSGTLNIARIPVGTSASTVAVGNDPRLSDARTPLAHGHAGADITSGTVPYARLPVGTAASTVAAGNDARLSDPRTPLAHTHAGVDITSGTVGYARLPVGTSASTVAAGNDARFTDARTPTAHKSTHASGGTDALSPSDIGAVAKSGDTMTGLLNLSGAPTGANHAATKSYVDTNDANRVAKTGDTMTGALTFQALDGPRTLQPSNKTYTPDPSHIAQAPFSTMWHDLLAFNRVNWTTVQEISDGATWTAQTVDKRLFAMKENQSLELVDGIAQKAIRWTFSDAAWSGGQWLVIAHTYNATPANKTVLVESSMDGISWTARHTSTYASVSMPVWHYLNAPGGDVYLRVTVTWNSGGAIRLSSIRLLSTRWGDQGKGRENEFPYTWDEFGRMQHPDPVSAQDTATKAYADTKVPSSRQVSSGTGLAGGGDLTQTRTLSVVYGTTAGTSAQGNDSRLSDARTPLAHTHAQTDVTGLGTTLAAKADLVGGKVPQAQIPAVAMTDFLGAVSTQTAMLALSGQRGDWATRTDLGTDWQLIADDSTQLASWREMTYPASPVQSVAGRTGAVVLDGGDIASGTVPFARMPVGTSASTVAVGNDARLSDARTPLAHNHSGTEITSGTVAIARLPVGTTNLTVCRGDDARLSDARIPAALGVGGIQTAFITADVSQTNSASVIGANISIPVVANAIYAMEGFIAYGTPTAAGVKFSWSNPASSTVQWATFGVQTSSNSRIGPIDTGALTGFALSASGDASFDASVRPVGIVTTGASAGTISLFFGQQTANVAATTLRKGSWIRLTRLA